MPAYLEAIEGPAKGRKIELKSGEGVTVGSLAPAEVALSEDQTMASPHFYVGVTNGSLCLRDLSRGQGTLLNGQPVEAATLKSGDLVKAGLTTFSAGAPPPSPYPAILRVGGWGFGSVPQGWEAQEGMGLRLAGNPSFCATMTAVEEPLSPELPLEQYIENQIRLAQAQVPGIEAVSPSKARLQGAEEALALSVTSPAPGGGRVVQRQLYALAAGVVGVLTVTFLDSQEQTLRDALAEALQGLSFHHS
jgi:hypothetical protein